MRVVPDSRPNNQGKTSMTKQLATLAAALALAMAMGVQKASADFLMETGYGVSNPGIQLAQYQDPYEEIEPDGGGGYGGGGGGYGGGGGGYGGGGGGYGGGGGGYGGGYGGGGGGYGGRISCGRGRRIVERSGFYRVVPRDCGGRNYTYSAFRRGRPWIVRLNAFTGRIIATRPVAY
jgi:hypothetical protein